MTDQHDFDNTVVAILDQEPAVGDAIEGLARAGYEYELLRGDEGREHIDPSSEDGVMSTVRRLVTVFGDQHRIIDRLDDALARGRFVISIDIDGDNPTDAISILREHGGHYIWRLGEWTFTPIEK